MMRFLKFIIFYWKTKSDSFKIECLKSVTSCIIYNLNGYKKILEFNDILKTNIQQ